MFFAKSPYTLRPQRPDLRRPKRVRKRPAWHETGLQRGMAWKAEKVKRCGRSPRRLAKASAELGWNWGIPPQKNVIWWELMWKNYGTWG